VCGRTYERGKREVGKQAHLDACSYACSGRLADLTRGFAFRLSDAPRPFVAAALIHQELRKEIRNRE
jgi:hypothetical protein